MGSIYNVYSLYICRREFGRRGEDQTSAGLIRSSSTGTTENNEDGNKEKARVNTIEHRIKRPGTIGEKSSQLPVENRNSWNFSFTNLNTGEN